MQQTQQDFEERLNRLGEGTGDDEDRRLVKHYRREGYSASTEPADGSWLAGQHDDQSAEVDATTDNPDEWSALGYRELQRAARERGLNAGGSESDLIGRLREHDQHTRAAQNQE